jgi:hypothetical protein
MRAFLSLVVAFALLAASAPSPARATCFCMMRMPPPAATQQQRGITDDPSYNPASAVVLVREGRRTVMTIEAAYEGPAVELSLVVPIPGAIGRENVRTVSGTAFRRLDQRTAPRVRHVFPPCIRPGSLRAASAEGFGAGASAGGGGRTEAERVQDEFGVDIQDEWPVDEYDVTLLGAEQSTGLLAFLRERGLDLPDAAATMLRGYIESGHRFVLFTADPSRAQRLGESMMLSPIQLEYESDELRVPVRLGTLNSPGEQELLLYVISTEGRFDVANRPSVLAPTDLRMRPDARGSFAELYTSITDEVFRQTPGAAITEYVHQVGTHVRQSEIAPFRGPSTLGEPDRRRMGAGRTDAPRWTVSRIRHRYGTNLSDDLSLTHADPVRLERRWSRWPQLRVPRGRDGQSFFHVQYVVEHNQRCVSDQAQRWMARRFATAESMWESRHDLWPGEVILDPIESLGIEPRSHAPDGWPPPPPPAPTAPATAAASATPEQAVAAMARSGNGTSGQGLSGQASSGLAPSGNGTPGHGTLRRGTLRTGQHRQLGTFVGDRPRRPGGAAPRQLASGAGRALGHVQRPRAGARGSSVDARSAVRRRLRLAPPTPALSQSQPRKESMCHSRRSRSSRAQVRAMRPPTHSRSGRRAANWSASICRLWRTRPSGARR